MFGIGPMELVLILVVALLVLGPKRMPELARMLGRGLSEFRRASSDLKQSLALDDLQNDLRDGLTGAGTIKKPGQDQDRPAQAGDDLDPGKGEPQETQSESGDGSQPETDPTPQSHPGELPLDDDPNEHHDVSRGLGNDFDDTTKATNTAAAPVKPMAADPDLGNVPVGGAKPSAPQKPTDDERG